MDSAEKGDKGLPEVAYESDRETPVGSERKGICSSGLFGWLGHRHAITVLSFLALTVGYTQRVNLSIGIVAMTNKNTTLQTESQIPAGQLSELFGPKIVLTVGLGVCSLFTLLSPIAATGGWEWLCACRVIQGLGQGVLLPATHALLAKWAPPTERGRISTFTYAGAQFGTVVALPVGGELASTKYAGWPSIFYLFGGLGVLWTVAWMIFGASSPNEHRWISEKEREYIVTSLGSSKQNKNEANFGGLDYYSKTCLRWNSMAQSKYSNLNMAFCGFRQHLPTPWKDILTSIPFWAILLAHCGQNWGYWTLLTEMPIYMGSVLKFDIKKNGQLSSLPYVVMWFFSIFISWVSDETLRKGWLSITVARKIGNTIAHWGPGFTLIGLGFVPQDQPMLALGLLILAVGLNGASFVGFQVNHIDLSPNFAGTLMGITNCVSNIMSLLAPIIAGKIVPDSENANQWRIVFFVAAGIYFVFNLLFIIFGSGDIQPWNNPKHSKEGLSKGEIKTSENAIKETSMTNSETMDENK